MNGLSLYAQYIALLLAGLVISMVNTRELNSRKALLLSIVAEIFYLSSTITIIVIVLQRPIWIWYVSLPISVASTFANFMVVHTKVNNIRRHKVPINEEVLKTIVPGTRVYYRENGTGNSVQASICYSLDRDGFVTIFVNIGERVDMIIIAKPGELFWF